MQQTSWRHHYLPQFYLRGFSNADGKFKVFDVEKQRFIKSGKFFSPESYFFEKDGYSLIKDGIKDDFIETKFFKDQDHEIAKLLDIINSSPKGSNHGVTDNDMPLLQLFVSGMYWRLPANFSRIKTLLSQNDLKKVGYHIVNEENQPVENRDLTDRLIRDPNFAKALKYSLPLTMFPQIFGCKSLLRIQSFPDGFPGICCDNPVIFRGTLPPNLYRDDVIFPLTSNKVFLRSAKFNELWSTIKIEIDLLLLKQAVKYVSCTDERYIHLLNNLFEKNYRNIDDLRESVFHQLFD